MKASTEMLGVMGATAALLGGTDALFGSTGWRVMVVAGGAIGLVIFLVRFLDGEAVSEAAVEFLIGFAR